MSCTSKFASRLFAWLFMFVVIPVAAAQEPQPLRWKFSEADQLEIRMEQETSVRTTVDRRQVEEINRMDLVIDWKIESVDDDGTATIRQTISAIRAEVTLPDAKGPVTTTYDSAEERHRGNAGLLADSFSKVLNQPVLVTMTAQGEITDVTIPEETQQSIRQMPGSIEGRQLFSIESLKEMFQSAGTEFPESPVATGQSWQAKRDFSIGSPHQFTRETTYTLNDDQQIDFTSSITINSNVGENENPDVEFHTWRIAEQESAGQISFDFEAGHVTGSNAKTMFKTETVYQSMAVATTVESQIKMEVSRK